MAWIHYFMASCFTTSSISTCLGSASKLFYKPRGCRVLLHPYLQIFSHCCTTIVFKDILVTHALRLQIVGRTSGVVQCLVCQAFSSLSDRIRAQRPDSLIKMYTCVLPSESMTGRFIPSSSSTCLSTALCVCLYLKASQTSFAQNQGSPYCQQPSKFAGKKKNYGKAISSFPFF